MMNTLIQNFKNKSPGQQELIKETLHLLHVLGIPLTPMTDRRLERMALVFLAVIDVKKSNDWQQAKDQNDNYSLKSREIIVYVNKNFGESISSGSYDDIRRKDLKLLVLTNIVIQSVASKSRNDSTRGYTLNPEYSDIVRRFGSPAWDENIQTFLEGRSQLIEKLSASRSISKISVTLPKGKVLEFGIGEHNELQKHIIEDFLPRYGHGAEILYVGDAEDRDLLLEEERLRDLNFFELRSGELPDIIAYSRSRNWLYIIEAVHSSGCISPERLLVLKVLTKDCLVPIIYVTAFLNRAIFRRFAVDIAWETEVWIADNPDHLIHFNGEKFLGPYPVE
jgi:hypothetical protein